MSGLSRDVAIAVAIVLCVSMSLNAETPPRAEMARLVLKNGETIVGPVIERTDAGVTVLDLKSATEVKVKRSDIRIERPRLSESEVVSSVGIGPVIAWKLRDLAGDNPVATVTEAEQSVIRFRIQPAASVEVGEKLKVVRVVRGPDAKASDAKKLATVAHVAVTEAGDLSGAAAILERLDGGPNVGDPLLPILKERPIAVFDLLNANGLVSLAGKHVAEELITSLAQNHVRVVERDQLNRVLKELALQQTELFDQATAQRVGRQLGAYAVVTGTVLKKDRTAAEAHVRVVRVETGEILTAVAGKVALPAGFIWPKEETTPVIVVPGGGPAKPPVRKEPTQGLRAEYFMGIDFKQPVLSRIDPNVDWLWIDRTPAERVPPERFSVRWTGFLKAPQPGDYRIIAVSDDGVRLWIDDNLVLNGWKGQLASRFEAKVNLSKDPHAFRLEYFQDVGNCLVSLRWAQDRGFDECAIPPENLFPDIATAAKGKVPSPARAEPDVGLQRGFFVGKDHDRLLNSGIDRQIDHLFGYDAPDPQTTGKDFSLRWTGWLRPPTAGTYEIMLTSDDGVRFSLGNQVLVDEWHGQEPTRFVRTVDLLAGDYPLRVDYFNHAGTSGLVSLRWRRPGETDERPISGADLRSKVAQGEELTLPLNAVRSKRP